MSQIFCDVCNIFSSLKLGIITLQGCRAKAYGGEPQWWSRELSTDVRIIAATNVDLWKLVQGGHFRQDLLYRLRVLHLELPPLRERRGDATLLGEHFMKHHSERSGALETAYVCPYLFGFSLSELQGPLASSISSYNS